MELHVAVDDLLTQLRLGGYRPPTLKIYRDQLKPFALWLPAATRADLRRVSVADIDAYAAFVMAEPIGAGCRRLRVRVVKRLFGFLAARGTLFLNPAERLVEPARRDSLPSLVASVKQVRDLLAAPDVRTRLGLRDRALLEVLYATGVRVGELEQLTLADAQLRDELLWVQHGKGDKPRVVPLGHQAAFWLSWYLRDARPHLTRRFPDERALFVVRTGRPLKQSMVREILYKYCRAQELAVLWSPHDLRHACATHLLRAGADIRAIQSLLGHQRLDSTAIYTEVAAADVRAIHRRYHPKEIDHADQ